MPWIKVNSEPPKPTTFEDLGYVQVVRCKDCKYAHKTYDGDCKYCDMFTDDDGNPVERYRSGDWFCADGERK